MVLNEITKGMSNAAEMINANFKNVGYEYGKNEKGEYVKFANGFAICWREIEVDRATTGQVGIDKPILFKAPVFGGISTSSSSYVEGNDISIIWVANYIEAWRWGTRPGTQWTGTGKFKATLWAAGMVA